MRKRYSTPRRVLGKKVWKWIARDEATIREFERDWQNGRPFVLRGRGRS